MSALRDAAAGAAAGLGATVAMSGVMLAARKAGLMSQSPPREMVERLADTATDDEFDDRAVDALASAAHLGFGAAGGAVFGLVAARAPLPGPRAAHGIAYALIVWLVSYAGWVPALRLMPPAHRDERSRQPVMVLAHVVYGAVLGSLFRSRASRASAPARVAAADL